MFWTNLALAMTLGLMSIAFVASGYLLRPINYRFAARSCAVLGTAVFLGVRPGFGNRFFLPALTPVAVGLFLSGVLLASYAPRKLETIFSRVLDQRPTRRAAFITGVVVLLSIPPLASRLAQNWDVSGFMDSHSYDTFAINIANGKEMAGNSAYMPAYQYGLAGVYFVFGHFFFVSQLVNLVLACIGIGALCWATWLLFESVVAMLVVGVLAIAATPFLYAVFFTQIESWYVPLVAVTLLAWAHYWRRPSTRNVALIGVAASVGMNMRNQGAPFFAFLSLAPFFVAGLSRKQRTVHIVTVIVVVTVSLLPWTIRNYYVDGRLSPSGSRSAMYMGVLNDPRIGLYGIRYWDGWDKVAAEFVTRYEDPADREKAFVRSAWAGLTTDPGWLVRALSWRIMAFYGLLPDGYLAIGQVVPTDWRTDWRKYVFARTTPLLLLPLSAAGLMMWPRRTTLFLAGAIIASLTINFVSATSEDRLSHPVLLLHMLLAAAVFAPPQSTEIRAAVARTSRVRTRHAVGTIVAVIALLVVCRIQVGSRFTYRPLLEQQVSLNQSVVVDRTYPLLNERAIEFASERGRHVRLRGMLTNYMYPPKFVGAVEWVPEFATDPRGPIFYYVTPIASDGRAEASSQAGVTFRGAQVSDSLREGDAVEIEGELLHVDRTSGPWLRALHVEKLPMDARALPPFR